MRRCYSNGQPLTQALQFVKSCVNPMLMYGGLHVLCLLQIILWPYIHTVESSNKGLFGTNINSSGLSLYRDCPLLRDSNRIILIGGIKFGDLDLSIVERQCPFLGGSYLRDSTVLPNFTASVVR